MIFELAQLSIGNLLRARARLIITAGGVVVGTTAVILLIAITIGLQTAAEAGLGSSTQLTQIDVYPSWSPDPAENIPQLDVESVQNFWNIEGVQAVIPVTYLYSEVWSGDYVGYPQIVGIDPRLLPYLGLQVSQGELSLTDGKVIAGFHAGEYFNDPEYTGDEWQPITVDFFESPPTLRLYQYSSDPPQDRDIRLQIGGQFAEGTMYDYAIIMPLQDVIGYRTWTEGTEFDPETFRYDQVTVFATSRETTNDVSEAIRDLGYATGGMSVFIEQLNGFFRTMRIMLGGVGGVALLVAAFGVANTMTMSILERTKEIGLMKAIGATDQDVLSIFLIEASLVGMTGGTVGVILSLFLQRVINRAIENIPTENGIPFLPVDTSQLNGNLIIIPTELWVFAIALATLVGLAAGFFPSLRAARMAPVIALKQE